ncbi:dehydrogenase/reductase SDR family member on chromosome X isoform X3 [Elephas maximus indicus]|uniref:dehydrogenase/reductase SDR family member on chromosome X isoform X3 n=1 Tax=Elephas maximus indicus TaxID=99487 RepID=UPI00211622B1|nr:dehydrogenase/reductase SDR family member on chromosome X isoform X3 [Elephas maximus indicus]
MSPLCAARAAVRVYAAGAAVILAQLLRRLRGALPEPVFPPQPDRVAIVTGGTDGIGYATAKHLARLGMHVVIAGNNERKSQEAVRTIKEETLNNKAGVMMVPQRTTRDGFEEHFGVNYLGHFLLTNLLLDTLKESGSPGCCARVVTVSSATHYVGELNMEDLQSSCGYSPAGAYAQSKLALVLFTYHLQSLLASSGSHVTANAVDPGVVNTDLYRHVFWGTWLVKRLLGWLLFKKQITKPFFRATSGWTPTSSLSTPDEGARTSIYAAVAPELEGVGGRYLYNEEATQSLQITYDKKLQRQLWARSCEMTRVLDVTQDGLAG